MGDVATTVCKPASWTAWGVSGGAEVCPGSFGIVREGCSHPSRYHGMLLFCPGACRSGSGRKVPSMWGNLLFYASPRYLTLVHLQSY